MFNTRFSDAGNCYVNKSRLSVRLNSFSSLKAKVWNCLKLDHLINAYGVY